jgi:hypothetical protein
MSKLRKGSELEEMLALQLKAAGIPFSTEVEKLIPGRKFRFDFMAYDSNLQNPILIEVEGATWVRGAHSTGVGIARDIEKSNLAVLGGYRVFRFTKQMIDSGAALEMIERALKK